MDSFDIYSLFMLGFLGTGHCLGMCGPLVFAFPGQTGRLTAHLCYHTGRILTYTIIGVLMGGVGSAFELLAVSLGKNPLEWVALVQIGFSILAAGFLFGFGILRLGLLREPGWMSLSAPSNLPGYKQMMQSVVAKKSAVANLPLGLLLGILPCGLSFAAFARSLASGGPIAGGAMALAFGAGTLPGLLAFGFGAFGFAKRFRKYSDLVSGALMIGMAVRLGVKSMLTLL